jgi:ribosomal protein L24
LTFDAWEEMRVEIEEVAADGTQTAEERAARLNEFKLDLTEMLGVVATYIGDAQTEASGRTREEQLAVERLRESADIRAELLERGVATEEALDDALMLSHEAIDQLVEDGMLEETAMHVAGFMRKFEEGRHPRGRGGKWIDVLGKITKLKEGDSHSAGMGVRAKNMGGTIHVQRHGKTLSKHTNRESAARALLAAAETAPPKRRREPVASAEHWKGGTHVSVTGGQHKGKSGEVVTHHASTGEATVDFGTHVGVVKQEHLRQDRAPGAGGAERAAEDTKIASRAAEQELSPEEKKALYDERKTRLETQAVKAVKSAAERGKLSDAESHFSETGRVSQRTLANYVEEASTSPQTSELYSSINAATGERVWNSSRKVLHERIITAYLKKRKIDPETGKSVLDYSPDAEDLQSHPDGPRVLFSGGGYASGKGGVLKILAARGETPPDSFVLDPDQIKAELPEFQAMIGTDPEANMHVYREAWAIAQEIQARAMEKKLNITVDGISNTAPEEMGQRVKAFTDRGYSAHVVYADIPTEEALKRAANRAENAKEDSDRRMIPEIIMRSVHRDVAATVPALPGYLDEHGIPAHIEVWNNDQGKDEQGQFRPPLKFFEHASSSHPGIAGVGDKAGGELQTGSIVHDQGLWDAFRNKGHESISHVEGTN